MSAWHYFNGVLATTAFSINRPAECAAGLGKPLVVGWDACWTDWPNQQGFSSLHVGGAHFTLCDGSSRFISQNIDLGTYRSLGTIQGARPSESSEIPILVRGLGVSLPGRIFPVVFV